MEDHKNLRGVEADHEKKGLINEDAHAKPVLTVITGGMAGQFFKVLKGVAVIGRGSTAEVKVEDDGISRVQVVLEAAYDGLRAVRIRVVDPA